MILTIPNYRVLCHFSCGAASAIATKLAIEKYGKSRVSILHIEIKEEHSDNKRFLSECQEWFGVPINTVGNDKFGRSIYKVFERGYLKGIHGAPCTTELKRKVRAEYQQENDIHVFGYTLDEKQRAWDFEDRNPELKVDFILIDKLIKKSDCYSLLMKAGIELPTMYKLGYNNNNCIGCVKGGMGYWNKIRKDFPEQFNKMASIERQVGHSILRDNGIPLFLDELDPNRGRIEDEPDIECSFFCREIGKDW